MRLHFGVRAAIAATLALTLSSGVSAAGTPATIVRPAIAPRPSLGPDMLGTVAVSIHANRFTGSLSNALQDASTSPILLGMIAPARGLTPLQQLSYVQSHVHNSIRWISDATEWGLHDYWATASQTLAHGAGDMEDRAVVKMHALKALGFRPENLFLTMARDRVGGPITVLTVRMNGHYIILDDTGGAPFDVTTRRNELQPILSFGWTGAWVHTHVAPPVPIAALAPAARSK